MKNKALKSSMGFCTGRFSPRSSFLLVSAFAAVVFCRSLQAQDGGRRASSEGSTASVTGQLATSTDAIPVAAGGNEGATAREPSRDNRAQAATQSGNGQTPNVVNAGGRATPTKIESHEDVPAGVQNPNPYGLASLKDLYIQVPSGSGGLKRFGSDVFLFGSGNTESLPIDIPVGPDYVLGPGDTLVVNMTGGHSERMSALIDRQGQISLPEAGSIELNGLTVTAAQQAIQKALARQFTEEHVEISLGRLRTIRVYVVGDVQRPGAYDVSSLSTPLSALYAAGGPTSRGSLRVLRQYRGKELVRQIDLYDFLLHGVRSNNERVLPGDTIMIPAVGSQVTIEGTVHRPAIYEMNGEQTLDQVLDLAGGVLATASLKQINIERLEPHEKRTMLSLQLSDNAGAVQQEIAAFKVQGGDDVVIFQILPYNQQAIYIEGHVFRPGKFPYHEGMTINDLLHSYQDVLPEPANHAELVRLLPPDYRPQTISFNLADVLVGNSLIALQPFDLIRVFSRYEIDAPTVSIEGDVLRPGIFPLSQGMTIADLVRMAGDFKRSAYRDEAGLSSYVVENGQRVLINHSVIPIRKALDGEKSSNVLLKPGDVVSIKQLAGWQDIGSSVTVTGEVEHAGSYGIEQGERLSAVIKRAGGFRVSAYPQAALFERVQVRDLSEEARASMIRRIETTPIGFKPGVLSPADEAAERQSLQEQRGEILAALRNHPSSGRMLISVSSDFSAWENTAADVELRSGDRLIIPKRPDFVLVSGQVYNATAISFVPGKAAGWYLKQSGGTTASGDKKRIYVLRADGAVVPQGTGWREQSLMNLRMQPGDTIVVPEKIVGGSMAFRNVLAIAQIASSVAITGAIAGVF
jgi:protein involved in polysaccharide export with SLBB domain